MDAGSGGSMSEFPGTIAKAVASLTNIDTLITGHANTPGARPGPVLPSSPVMTRRDLQEYSDFLLEFTTAARAALAAGKSVDDAVAAWPLPARYRDYEMTGAKADVQRLLEESKR